MAGQSLYTGLVPTVAGIILAAFGLGQQSAIGATEGGRTGELMVHQDGAETSLSLGDGELFYRTTNPVSEARLIDVPESTIRLVLWQEALPTGERVPFYAISLDGRSMATIRQTSYVLKVRHGDFDPMVAVPPVEPSLAATETTNLYIVQFVTQPLQAFRTAIEELGGTVYTFFANHAHIVKMSPQTREAVAALPYVRWVGPFHPAYRLEEFVRDNMDRAEELFPFQRYNVQVFESGPGQKTAVGERIESIGGKIEMADAGKYLLEATLTPQQLFEVIRWDEVLFVDRWSPLEMDMDIVREIAGANYIESVAGYTGDGVRAEVFDGGFNLSHPDLQDPPLITHGSVGVHDHGAATSGICFGDGTGDPQARGLMPHAQGIVADYNYIGMTGTSRYNHTGELLEDPYYAVFQTASVGSDRTTQYTTISADTDAMLFDFDLVHCQSQSNAGNQDSRPQAWAKNIVSGGAVEHYDTPTREDDCWCYSASIGPASDGRIKPDLCFFYDYTYTTYSTGSGYGEFGGTSGATPSICGHIGLFLEMWADGIFGNEVTPGGTVFENRPHMATTKAVMINTASPYDFTGTTHDLTRTHQGWGLPDLQYLYDMRENISIVDETELVTNMETREFLAYVEADEPMLRVTMVYTDPPGNPASSQHRINDLSLRVTAPSGTFYWGNNGLLEGNWSVPGGTDNTIDTVENVFVENPESGVWTVEVIASEIVQDSHVETPDMDADFALVVSGGFLATCTSDGRISLNKAQYACESEASIRVVDCDLNTDDQTVQTVTVSIASDSEPAGESVLLTETAPETADFRGTINLSTADSTGVLLVAHGDLLTATYIDADDGQGGTEVEVTDEAIVDCVPPVISDVLTSEIEPRSAVITFNTDEPAAGTVHYGASCGALTETVTVGGLKTNHEISLTGLDDNTTYYYAVEAEDEAGNTATDDNGGACYTFTTPEVPDFFTEQFGGNNDLDFLTLTFEPSGTVDFYAGCTEPIEELPTDPAGGTPLSISEDSYQQVTLGDGQTVSLYGVSYSSFYVCDNGYITFGSGDTDYTESLADHFDMPRISAVFDDFSVDDAGGYVSWKQLSDRAAVTYENVPEYGTSNSSTFQVELFFDGTITISYLEVAVNDGIAGLSEGEGLSPDFYATDLSEMGACGPKPPTAMPVQVTGPVGADSIAITLEATDDGLPDPPAALTYIVTTLPTQGDLYEPGFGQITSVPHELADNGNELTYQPEPTYHGLDSFQYVANDGGVPPEGGDSDPATVLITVGGSDWDPQAFNVSASTPASTPVDVVLNAMDPNGDPLTYFIESLPASGTLNDPGAGAITEVPYELVGGGNIVQYAPPEGEETLTAQFTYSAADATAGSNIATVTVTVGGPAWAPVAYPVTAATPISTPVDITLNAIDPNGDPLTYFIESLPIEGTLDDPGAGAITEVPYELVDGGAVVRYTPPIYQNLEDEFLYSARDATAGSNVALVSVTVGGPMTFFEDDFETDKGWTIENIELETGAWERLVPIAGSQGAPSSDYDGSGKCYLTERAIGADVDGGPTRLISPTVNVAGVIDPKLRYARWFTNDDGDQDRLDVEISNDNGVSWVLIESVPDTVGWVEQTIEMVDYLTPGAQMKVRFGAMDNPNNSITEGAIDAIEIWGLPEIELPGDYDGNSIVDLADFAYFPECMTGPDAGPATTECEVFYFNADDDVDLGDFTGFQAMMAEFN